jgi:putative endonuclease
MDCYYVYILSDVRGRALQVGVTDNLSGYLREQRARGSADLRQAHAANRLVYYEFTEDPDAALSRERQIRGWRRERKETLINAMNPQWDDLTEVW